MPPWTACAETLHEDNTIRFSIRGGPSPLTVNEVAEGWRTNAAFRAFFSEMLASVPYSAFRWETPAATKATQGHPFECVVVHRPRLHRSPDRQTFADHFHGTSEPVLAFPNLGRDAVLVVPAPIGELAAYPHLAAFVRSGPADQQQAFWQKMGEVYAERLGAKPFWLNTAGAGVAWLHVRFDDSPKYYSHEPYKQRPLP